MAVGCGVKGSLVSVGPSLSSERGGDYCFGFWVQGAGFYVPDEVNHSQRFRTSGM
jgi:hypothetical protein